MDEIRIVQQLQELNKNLAKLNKHMEEVADGLGQTGPLFVCLNELNDKMDELTGGPLGVLADNVTEIKKKIGGLTKKSAK
jgi:hypothetical protein